MRLAALRERRGGLAGYPTPPAAALPRLGLLWAILRATADGLGRPLPYGPFAAFWGVSGAPSIHLASRVPSRTRDARVDEGGSLRTRHNANRPEVRFRTLTMDGTLKPRLA